MTQEELKMELEELAVRFSEGWHEGIKIDASDIMLLNEAAQALAQPEQEPVAWTLLLIGEHHGLVGKAGDKFVGHPEHYERVDVYPTPPQRTWVGLTDEEIDYFIVHRLTIATKNNLAALIRICEAKLKEKNQ